MAFEHKDNSGSLFKNGYKTEDKHPDHQGSCKIVCPECSHAQEYKISGWVNELKEKSGRYFSLRFGLPHNREQETPLNYSTGDDIPF